MNVLKALRLSAVAGAILGLLTLAMPTTASADVFTFSYTNNATSASSAIFGFGQFTTGSSVSPALVTGVTGFSIWNGVTDTITGLSATLFGGADNLLSFPNAPFVNFNGISFSTAASGDFNLYSEGFQNLIWSDAYDSIAAINFQITPATNVAAVPEASTWAMMILGFLGLGFLGYRRSSGSSNPTFRMA
jgi:hypothetical protein